MDLFDYAKKIHTLYKKIINKTIKVQDRGKSRVMQGSSFTKSYTKRLANLSF